MADPKIKETRDRLISILTRKMGWSRPEALIWFHSKSPKLGGRSPQNLIEDDKEKKLRTFIEDLKKEKAQD